MTERYMVDDAGTLIDIETRNTYDYVSEICPILNELDSENKTLKQQLESEHQMLNNAILLERTRMGKNSLKQFKQQLGGNND